MKTTNNLQQVGGNHYEKLDMEPVLVIASYQLDWFQGEILKYVSRYKFKNGLTDIKKGKHVSRMARELRGDFNYLGTDKEVKYEPNWGRILDLYINQYTRIDYFNEPTSFDTFSQLVVAIVNYDMKEVYRLINNLMYLEYEEKEE